MPRTLTRRARAQGFMGSPDRPGPAGASLRGPEQRAHRGSGGHHVTAEEILEALKNGEVEAHFQPRVHTRTLQVVGAATSARWRHPRAGVVKQDTVIRTLEIAGKINALTSFLLKRAADFALKLGAAGYCGTVGVGVGLDSLSDTEWAKEIAVVAAAGGGDLRRIVLDVRAPAPEHGAAGALGNLAYLRALGFGLSIDAYGHGYLSLQQLADVRFTELRIAPELAMCARHHECARPILAASIGAARCLNIPAIAEDIETAEDWALMKTLGCDVTQGSYTSEPMAERHYLQWLTLRPHLRRAAS